MAYYIITNKSKKNLPFKIMDKQIQRDMVVSVGGAVKLEISHLPFILHKYQQQELVEIEEISSKKFNEIKTTNFKPKQTSSQPKKTAPKRKKRSYNTKKSD